MKKIDYKKLIFTIVFTILIGSFFAMFVKNNTGDLITPKFYPPKIVFPIVWSILYILMGISYYLIDRDDDNNCFAKSLYFIQLIFNSLWTLIFFGLNLRLFGFIWIVIIFILVLLMVFSFYKINKKAAFLQIPYLIWLAIAGYLNLSLYLLNR